MLHRNVVNHRVAKGTGYSTVKTVLQPAVRKLLQLEVMYFTKKELWLQLYSNIILNKFDLNTL